MLKQRVLTALVLAAVFLSALFLLSPSYFVLFVLAVCFMGAWEWANFADLGALWQRLSYLAGCALLFLLAGVYLSLGPWPIIASAETLSGAQIEAFRNLLVLACLWWALALLWVQSYPQSTLLWGSRWVRAIMGFLVLVPAGVALVFIRVQDSGAALILLLVLIVASADIGAFFAGRRWGRHKLAASVSPGKTWQGFAGGVAANLLLALLVWRFAGGSLGVWLALILPASLVSVLGDLLESMLKRHRGIKDSGAVLPGHGGILDRLDSLTAAAPVFALALLVTGGPAS